ncbi:tail fiber assembly protein [Erwinia amylovora]|uniref:tail fiber assembly protein n=1 Tax=Erwinia amylovora TaxID=552 RepID=UPI0014439D0C|nr:tail fiber assembly protein [Erwinia amylovora]
MIKLSSVFTNFKEYKPDFLPDGAPLDSRFFCDDAGNDWYDLMYQFDKTDWKIGYLADGYVVWATKDVIGTYSPAGLSIAVVSDVPGNKERGREDIWFFEHGEVIAKLAEELVDPLTVATEKKHQLMADANAKILLIERAIKLKMATDADHSELEDLERYTVLLSRTEISSAPDVQWPEIP